MCDKLQIGNTIFKAERNEKNGFTYTPTQLPLANKKAKYQDKPQFKIIEVVETGMKRDGQKMISQIEKDIITLLQNT